jgi:hypothetical protein
MPRRNQFTSLLYGQFFQVFSSWLPFIPGAVKVNHMKANNAMISKRLATRQDCHL